MELRLVSGNVTLTELPPLPVPLAEMSGEAIGNTLYLFSGRTSKKTSQTLFKIDLDSIKPQWEALPWPGEARGRMHSIAGRQGGKLYWFGGRDRMSEGSIPFSEDRMEPEGLDFLRDCYSFDPATSEWERLADLPVGLSAAPSPAVSAGEAHLLLLGGVTVDFLKEQLKARPELNGQGHEHPGFPKTIWGYHTVTNTWAPVDEIPAEFEAPVTVPVVMADANAFFIPSGEIKPGVRTRQVIRGQVESNRASFGVVNWIVVAVYLLAMVAIGYDS